MNAHDYRSNRRRATSRIDPQRHKEAQKVQTHNQYLLCFLCIFVALKLFLSTFEAKLRPSVAAPPREIGDWGEAEKFSRVPTCVPAYVVCSTTEHDQRANDLSLRVSSRSVEGFRKGGKVLIRTRLRRNCSLQALGLAR
jgi:hypothetical protein